MSRPHARTKDSFQGINVRRLPRSELDDSTMRDLNRYDNRLDNSLRDVEKAKEVMMRSLEKDKNIFMRGGIRSNKKYTVTMQNPGDSRQRRDSTTSQPSSKYHSDIRNKKPGAYTTNASQHPSQQQQQQQLLLPTGNGANYHGRKQSKQQQPDESGRDILAETRDVIDKQKKGDSLVEEFISNHASGGQGRVGTTGDKQQRYYLSPTVAESMASNRSDSNTLDSRSYESSGYDSATPTIRVDAYHQPSLGSDGLDYCPVNNGKFAQGSSQQYPFYDDLSTFGPTPTPGFWNRMSTPKNPSRNLQKREQLEREFSSPALKSRATTPAAPKSAKGSRTLLGSTTGSLGTTTSTSGTTTTSANMTTTATTMATAGKSGTRKKSSPVAGVKTKPKTSGKGK